jgi:hypothetical protein
MKFRVHSALGFGVLSAGVLATGCSQPAPLQQSALAPAASVSQSRSPAARLAAVFPLVGGSFTVQNAGGDGITGTYAGTATFGSDERERSSLTLQVNGGSGAFAGATGSLTVTGQGAFSGEGTFVLDGSGEVRFADGRRAVLVLRVRGSSTAGCNASNQIQISQTAEGTLGRLGRVTATLTHAVENTGCSS